jgi:hypothetical protein
MRQQWMLTALMTLALTVPSFPHGNHGAKGCCKGKEAAKCEKCEKMAEGKGGCCKKAKDGQEPAAKSEPGAPKQ